MCFASRNKRFLLLAGVVIRFELVGTKITEVRNQQLSLSQHNTTIEVLTREGNKVASASGDIG